MEDSPRHLSPQLGLVALADLPHPGKKDKRESELTARLEQHPLRPQELSLEMWGEVSRSRLTGDPAVPTEPTMPLYPRGPWAEEGGAGQS